jgi:hypothetical protein
VLARVGWKSGNVSHNRQTAATSGNTLKNRRNAINSTDASNSRVSSNRGAPVTVGSLLKIRVASNNRDTKNSRIARKPFTNYANLTVPGTVLA